MRLLAGLFLVLHTVLPLPAHAASEAKSVVTQQAVLRIVAGLEEPLVATGPTTRDEDMGLDLAIASFRTQPARTGDFADTAKPFIVFLAAHPDSAWRSAIQTNLGIGYYRAGYFSRAMLAWDDAWQTGRNAKTPEAKALVDRAVGELARMHARVGHSQALEQIFADLGDRPISGPATEMISGAHEGLWMFRNEPEKAFLCGPMAVKNLLTTMKADPARINAIDQERSGPNGYSLAQVSALASRLNVEHRLIYRTPDQPVPVPSIINWKINHYAAIVEERDGLYHVQDPTFGSGDLWITKTAIDEEGSGFFLVPAESRIHADWRTATADEAERIHGMGQTATNQQTATTPCDAKGMCVASAMSMLVSLNLNDNPVGYRPSKGPSAQVSLTYNQREAGQPAVFSFFNVSPKWTLNFLSWVQDNPNAPGASVLRYVAGGGYVDYSYPYSYSTATGAFTPERQGQAVLIRIPATGPVTSYELRMPDGSKQVFAKLDGATTTPRRIFMTGIVDAAGNALTLNYDAQLRLASITDATGRNTLFSYGAASSPLLVTQITDPFGRHADLTYDAAGRLSAITDVIGITSSFTYDAGGLVNAMTTPYGTSTFSYGQNVAANSRFLEATDPLGFTERFEFMHSAPGIAGSDSVLPAGLGLSNIYLQYRNTFHWDKHLYPITHTDYTKAHLTHWLHNANSQTSPIPESVKPALERRVWFKYTGQGVSYFDGTANTTTGLGRVLDDGSTQARLATYNAIGKALTATDPLGRNTFFTYDASGVDLLSVRQQTTSGGATAAIAAFTYNAQHRPLTYTDAAGQTTSFSYNTAGQLTAKTDALGKVTTYTYDGFGRLTTITNANFLPQQSFTYDAYDHVATSTDSEGLTLAYSYDALDRVTQIQYPDGTTTQNVYDKLDLVSVKDRLGRVTTYIYDANRRLTSVTNPLGLITRYGYYETGALKSITDPKGNVTSWDIDIQGRPTAKRYADGKVEAYTYEGSTSRLKTKTDALNQIKTLTYFNDDQLKAISYTGAVNQTANVSFGYDAFFLRRVSMTDGVGTTTWTYQPVGTPGALRMASETGPYGSNNTVAYAYDGIGRVSTRTVDSAAETFAYDNLDRLTGHTSALGAFNLGYLGQTGQVTSQQSSTGTVGTQWAYDTNTNNRRLLSITNSGIARSFSFSSLPENLITGITESVSGATQRTWAYGYDNASRLTNAQPSTGAASSYGYDGADNLTSINGTSATVNNVNQITSLGGTAYTYDANGNLLNDGIRAYAWDAESRLVGIGYSATPGKSTGFRYDGLGRRVAIVEYSGGTTSETRYLWCGDSLCQARTSGDVVTRRYFPEGQAIPQGGTLLFYGTDQLGSVRDVSAVQNGSRVASYDYDAYGNQIASSGRISTDFRYGGMFYHGMSGLYLTNYRAYDPKAAKWLSRDPIAESGGLNLYAYADKDPISKTDRKGLFTEGALASCVAGGPYNPVCDAAVVVNACKWVGIGALTVIDIILAQRSAEHAAECKKEWEAAEDYCKKLYDSGYTPPANGKGVGGMNYGQCVRGHVSEECGGTPVEH